MADDEDFKRWARDLCTRLKVTPPFTPEILIAAVERLLDCRITLVAHDLEGSTIYGCCAVVDGGYLIAYRQDATFIQRARTIYHEVCHLLRGHLSSEGSYACREFGPTSSRELEAESAARALESYADSGLHHLHSDDSGLESFWDEMGSDD